jgi:putative hydrolase of HD superfamily
VARAHRQSLLTDDLSDNIASHSYRVSIIGWFLAQEAKADVFKVTTMCLFHDAAETRSGDQNWVHKRFIKVFDDEIALGQLSVLPESELLKSLHQEYTERTTLEARLAKDADLIDQILLLKEYEMIGNQEAARWLQGQEQAKRLTTEEGKALLKEIYRQRPSEWWDNLWTEQRR